MATSLYEYQPQCRGSRLGFRTVHRPRRIGRASLSRTSWCATRTSGRVARTSRRVAGRSYEVIGVLLHNLRRAAVQTFMSPIHIYSATAECETINMQLLTQWRSFYSPEFCVSEVKLNHSKT